VKAAEKSDWSTRELPSKRTTIPLDRSFSAGETKRMRAGLVPEEMEDKWFIYWHNNALFFHRSWTGSCIYVVRFAEEDDGYRMVEADVNRDPEQYGETSDERDASLISYLIDVLLLSRDAAFPSDESSLDNNILLQWSGVGRAMLSQHPDNE